MDAGPVTIVKGNDASDVEDSVDVEEIDHFLIEGVGAIDVGEVDFDAFRDEARQSVLREFFAQLDEIAETRGAQVVHADAAPGGALKRVDGDVTPAADSHQGLADIEGGNPVGQTDFQSNGRAFFFDDLDPDIADAIRKAIQVFTDLHAEIRDIKLEVPTDRTLASAEAYAYHKVFVDRSPELYQPATLARIVSGANISTTDALRASRELQASRYAIHEIFDDVDVLLTPTVPIPPPTIVELQLRPENLRAQELMMLRNTRPFNVWGIPTISIPCGFTRDGMPIGLQLAAAPWRGIVLLQAAQAYEQATGWHEMRPAVASI